MNKKTLITSLFAAALTLSAQALTLYPNGVLAGANVSLSDLISDGWSVQYNQAYGNGAISETDISGWAAAAGSGYVFVGGIDGQGNVILGATGKAEVLNQTYSNSVAASYGSSNLYWYNVDNNSQFDPIGSMGFAPISTINLFEADTYDTSDPYRLSWHIDYSGGGWRLGSYTDLNFSSSFNRIVLVAPNGGGNQVPDTGSTMALLGAALVGAETLRRRLVK